MNIFALSSDPETAAKWHCDCHVNKMIIEAAQMLSTAHRILDGVMDRRLTKSGKMRLRYWELEDDREDTLYINLIAYFRKKRCTKYNDYIIIYR